MKLSSAGIAFDELAGSSNDWLGWIRLSGQFEDALKASIPWNDLSVAQRDAVQEKLKTPQPSTQLMLNSLYVTLVAGFEEYLRNLVRSLADGVSQAQKKYGDLPTALLKLNMRESARILKRIDSPPDYLPIDGPEMCRRLGTCHSSSAGVELNSDALADVEGLVKIENLIERLSAFAIPLSFDDLGKDESVCKALGMPTNRVRAAGNTVRDTASEIARIRNRIAHMGGNASDVTVELLETHTKLLRAITAAIDGLVTERVRKAAKLGHR